MEFSRHENWSGLPFPSPGDLPDPGVESRSPALQADALPSGSLNTETFLQADWKNCPGSSSGITSPKPRKHSTVTFRGRRAVLPLCFPFAPLSWANHHCFQSLWKDSCNYDFQTDYDIGPVIEFLVSVAYYFSSISTEICQGSLFTHVIKGLSVWVKAVDFNSTHQEYHAALCKF